MILHKFVFWVEIWYNKYIKHIRKHSSSLYSRRTHQIGGMEMKKVFLMVELTDENGGHVYAIRYTGVMTHRNIYAQLTQNTGCPEPEYIKVAKYDTIDCTENGGSIFSGRIYRYIKVSCNVGMNDSRIQKTKESFSNEILEAIHCHVQENEELLAAL